MADALLLLQSQDPEIAFLRFGTPSSGWLQGSACCHLTKGPAGTDIRAYHVLSQTPGTVRAKVGRQGRLAFGVGPSMLMKGPGWIRWSSSKLPCHPANRYLPELITSKDKWGKLSGGASTARGCRCRSTFQNPPETHSGIP